MNAPYLRRGIQDAVRHAACDLSAYNLRSNGEPVIRVTVGLDQSDHDQLSYIAESAGVSLPWMMRRAA